MTTVVITGHTHGIGLALKNIFEQHNFTVIGFSTSTGHDIADQSTRQVILDAIKDADIFINNAWHPEGQFDLLKKSIDLWEDSNKFIINVSSKITLCPFQITSDHFDFETYTRVKKEQNKFLKSRIIVGRPKILNILTGLVETNMADLFTSPNKIKSNDLAELVYTIYEFRDRIAVQEIVTDVPGLNWEDISLKKD